MRKILFLCLLFCALSSISVAQTFRPSMNIIARGNYSVWLSDTTWKDAYKPFPGVQLDVAVNLNSTWGIFGTFGADFISPEDRTASIPGATFTQENSTQISGYVGPRYYINIPGNKNMRIYLEAGAGLYSFKPGDMKITETTNPPRTTTTTFNSVSQFGFNTGAGMNINLSPQTFINFLIKYHNVLKKTNVVFVEKTTVEQQGTTTTTTTNSTPEDIPARSYFQFGLGIGFSFGL